MVEKTKLTIARYGWQLTMVEGGLFGPGFGYTAGLTERRHPELLVTGRDTQQTAGILHELVGIVLGRGHVLTAGMELPLHTREVYLAPLADPAPVLALAARIYRHRLRALQAVWVDDDGLLPWEQQVSDARAQPLYGAPPGPEP
ncbi:DUF4262 domain-containing protein [Arthrobacter mobilis]|uniref:DUF4262 domain-containing protein n=1 Tax=Arthrobacter mobilis TaxID=2724944 RepID=A0A7X6QMC1_9MICC|nr:DUF4262 domain-containing protein [Arthrobacter mobilis]NKX56345.1 DUF4262 domain-containing protein [Arthrobacter mobilis]